MNLTKEVVIAITLIIVPVFYPNTAEAGIFSFMGDKVVAKSLDTQDAPNSQNMMLLKAITNSDQNQKTSDLHPILASDNALVAEIGPAGTASDIDSDINTAISLYVVRTGDTFGEIAKMFGVSVNTIVWANDLGANPSLKVGETLVILPITGIRYTVKKGDTIKSVADAYKADFNEVLQYNGLSKNSLLVLGSTLLIPDAESTVPAKPPTKVTISVKSNYYMRPISGGYRSQGVHGHNGVDLAAPVGTPIYAAASGTVIASKVDGGWNGGYGNYVIISHPNGTQTLYAHTLVNLVSVGSVVKKGQTIARIGMTGKTTGPHVHFEIRGAVNPF